MDRAAEAWWAGENDVGSRPWEGWFWVERATGITRPGRDCRVSKEPHNLGAWSRQRFNISISVDSSHVLDTAEELVSPAASLWRSLLRKHHQVHCMLKGILFTMVEHTMKGKFGVERQQIDN